MEDKKVLNEKELNAVTGGAAEEGLNGHIYAVPTTEATNGDPQIIGGATSSAPALPATTLEASGYENLFNVPDSPNSTNQYEFHFYSPKKPTDKDF